MVGVPDAVDDGVTVPLAVGVTVFEPVIDPDTDTALVGVTLGVPDDE